MKTILALLGRDVRRTRRAPGGLILLLLFPLALGTIIAFAFGGSNTPQVRLILTADDKGPLAQFIRGALDRPEFEKHFQVTLADSAQGRFLLEADKGSAHVIFPQDFLVGYLRGDSTTVSVVKNPRENFMPLVVEEGVGILVDGLNAAQPVFGPSLLELRDLLEGDSFPDPVRLGTFVSQTSHVLQDQGSLLFPPLVTLQRVSTSTNESPGTSSIFLLLLPGFAVMTILMIADHSMRDLLREAARGTFSRCLTGPIRPEVVIFGKILFAWALCAASFLILTAFGAPFLDQPIHLGAYAALGLAFSLAAAGFASFTYGLARNERQGSVVGTMVLLVMSFLGGSYIPLDTLPSGIRALSPFTLNYWGVDGFSKILRDGASLEGIAPHLLVLGVLFCLFFFSGSRLLTRKLQRGDR